MTREQERAQIDNKPNYNRCLLTEKMVLLILTTSTMWVKFRKAWKLTVSQHCLGLGESCSHIANILFLARSLHSKIATGCLLSSAAVLSFTQRLLWLWCVCIWMQWKYKKLINLEYCLKKKIQGNCLIKVYHFMEKQHTYRHTHNWITFILRLQIAMLIEAERREDYI